jgi:hypothetical protein
VLEAADDVFCRIGLGGLFAPAHDATRATVARSRCLHGVLAVVIATFSRKQALTITEALRKNPALTALYVGYDDGTFFLVRPIRDEVTRAALKAPADARSSCRASSGRKAARPCNSRLRRRQPHRHCQRPDFAFIRARAMV